MLLPVCLTGILLRINKKGHLKSRFDCHIELVEILAIKMTAFDKLRLTTLFGQPLFLIMNMTYFGNFSTLLLTAFTVFR
jgi:hypothetical protein